MAETQEAGVVETWSFISHSSSSLAPLLPPQQPERTELPGAFPLGDRNRNRRALDGSVFRHLVSMLPESVVPTLKNNVVFEIGEFEETIVAAAFKKKARLTRDLETIREPNFISSWKNEIENIREKKAHRSGLNALRRHELSLRLYRWEERVKLTAHVINIKNSAGQLDNGIITPLLKKERQGYTSDEAWNLPAVQAVIDLKWYKWARKYLIIELIIYLFWLFGLSGFAICYIEEKRMNEEFGDMKNGKAIVSLLTYSCDAIAFIFMVPELLMEFQIMRYHKLHWVTLWNVLSGVSYIFQVIITFGHFTKVVYQDNAYDTILAMQCALLFIKSQYFGRLIGSGACYIEALVSLVYSVRYFLFFILFTMIGMSLCFAVLYRTGDDDSSDNTNKLGYINGDDKDDSATADLESTRRAVGTMYTILLGNFQSGYVYHTKNRIVKEVFFIFFQIIMSITVLNVLIAVMTEAYSTIMKKKDIMFYRGRAQVIDKIEVVIPKRWSPNWKPFVHFLVAETRHFSKEEEHEERLARLEQSISHINDNIGDIKKMLQVLYF